MNGGKYLVLINFKTSLLRVSKGRLKHDGCSKFPHGEKMIGAKRLLTLQKKT